VGDIRFFLTKRNQISGQNRISFFRNPIFSQKRNRISGQNRISFFRNPIFSYKEKYRITHIAPLPKFFGKTWFFEPIIFG
jgi:hypothetical protein